MNQQKIGEFIMLLRKEKKLTQTELANLIFVARETVSKWERGLNIPDPHSLVLLANIFDVSINEIIAGEYINESNEEQINTLLSILKSNTKHKRLKRDFLLIICIIIIIILIFFLAYFLSNFNTLRIYLISGANDDYYLSNSLIVLVKEKSYIQIGSIIDLETNTNISNIKDYKISLYYEENNKEYLIFSSNGSDTFYTNLNNLDDNHYQKLLNALESLYLSIEYEENISKIKLDVQLDYVNNHFFSFGIDKDNITDSSSLDDSIIIEENIEDDWQVITPVEYETPSKKITLSATCSKKENLCRVTFSTIWKSLPKIKSYDVIGIRLSDTFFLDEHAIILANDYLKPDYAYQSTSGLGAIFDLSKDEIYTITQSFNVAYQGTIYATYQHAIKDISLDNASNFSFSSNGLGSVISFANQKEEKSYDDLPGIKLILQE